MTGRTVFLLAAAAALAGAVLYWVRAPAPMSDEERIRALFDGAARAAQEKRVSDAVLLVSERFQGEGLDRSGVKQLVALNVLRGEWVSVTIASARIRMEGDLAKANVDVLLARGAGKGKPLEAILPGEASAHRLLCRLEREEKEWRIVEATWREVGLGEALAGPPEPP